MSRDPAPDDLDRAVAVLRRGGLVAFPTETVYGLGADAASPAAVRRIYEVKGRPPTHPVIVHVAGLADVDRWAASVPRDLEALAAVFWPGPLTVIVARGEHVPDEVTGGRETVALRVPAHPLALELIVAFGGGLAAPSANRFGHVSPTTAAHVREELGDAVDLVLDGGPCTVGVESTIVDLTGDEPLVRRPGHVTAEQLEAVLGRPVEHWTGAVPATASVAPGTLASHYAPRAAVHLAATIDAAADAAAAAAGAGRRVALLAPRVAPSLDPLVVELEPAGPPDHYARVLYDRLREVDRLGLDEVWVVPPDPIGVGIAVRDRLGRAAARADRDPGRPDPA